MSANAANQATGGRFAALSATNAQMPTRLPATLAEYALIVFGWSASRLAEQPADRDEDVPDQGHEKQRQRQPERPGGRPAPTLS